MAKLRDLVSGLLLAGAALAGDNDPVVKSFREVDAAFANPAKGWMTHQRLPKVEPRFPCSLAYFRLDWGQLEPQEGQCKWELIDRAIEAWKPRGVAIAFRIMAANAHTAGYYCSPKWLFDAGCKSHDYVRGGQDTMEGGARITRIEPEYSDPMFLSKHGAFLKALGQRYDGHPNVEFVDIGSYGIWGEWHTPNPADFGVRREIIDLYRQAFPRTPLVMMSDDAEALAYALQHGAGFRRDGVGSPWHEQNWIGSPKYARVLGFAEAWKQAPVVFEWFGPYDFLMRRGWSFDRAVDFMLNNHVTFINDNLGLAPPERLPKLLHLARLSGYRFVLRELSHPPTALRGTAFPVAMTWANVGVGRLYHRCALRVSLLDQSGRAVHSTDAQSAPHGWLPGEHRLTVSLSVPDDLPAGDYALALAIVDAVGARPPIKLAIAAPEQDGRYTVSEVRVK